jgi:anaerobic ribonucleoside-triphosphate reductase activating protein
MRLRLHSFVPNSRANGPGVRAVIWVQGCSLGCPGCFNPETHDTDRGQWVAVSDLFERIHLLGDNIEGVTLSGGEPLQQAPAVSALLSLIRRHTSLSTLLFTGFRWEEILRLPHSRDLLASLDVVLAGRYDARQRVAHGLRGSANKTVHFLTSRYSAADLEAVPEAEVLIGADGVTIVSGIDPFSPAI